jgi:hypothetical protein
VIVGPNDLEAMEVAWKWHSLFVPVPGVLRYYRPVPFSGVLEGLFFDQVGLVVSLCVWLWFCRLVLFFLI